MDAVLHPARMDRHGRKVTWQSQLASLPNGTFIEFDALPWLVWDDALALWTPEGYTRRIGRPAASPVTVLTPRPIVECLFVGYEPMVHPSLDG